MRPPMLLTDDLQAWRERVTRRAFLGRGALGLGSACLALAPGSATAPRRAAERPTRRASSSPLHVAARAKRVICLYMAGGPSHLETFDYKPKLAEMHGQPMPESFTKGQPIAQLQGAGAQVLRPAAPVSEVTASPGRRSASCFPHIGAVADDICIIRSMHDRGDQPRPGPHVHEHRHRDRRPAAAWARGSGTAWAARRATCPASSCSPRTGRGGQHAADRRAAVARRLPAQPLPGRPVPLAGRPGALPRATPPASRRTRSSATWSTPCSALNQAADRGGATTRRSPRASPSTRWPSACRPACRS